jgi:N-methylhydantoinase A/oxoprolinase/acetone carboxylase beta subunit
LLGYDPETLHDVGIDRIVARDNIVFLQGGHTGTGEELAPLDVEGAEEAIRRLSPRVSAFAVSGFFGVRNPTHELRVRRLVRDLTGLPVTCGHELTTHLNAPRRALTVAMNARLIPLLSDLVWTVRSMLRSKGIQAPLMVVKGDGSLMEADMALERPVETILSGPAASVVGACFLTEARDSFVIDMGGTTTDIAAVRQGQPVLNEQGVRVGNWDIMVEAIEVRTTGLGGDSETVLDGAEGLEVGPKRVIPLSLLAEQDPTALEALRRQMDSPADADQGRFVRKQKDRARETLNFTPGQREVWDLIGDSAVALVDLLARVKIPALYRRYLFELMEQGLVVMSGFTPTDAVHVLGRYRCWSLEAAEFGAALGARLLGETPKAFSERVVRQVEIQAGRAIMECALAEEGFETAGRRDGLERMMVDRALGANEGGSFSLSLSLELPVVAIGAPVSAYLPAVSSRVNAELRVPENAAVANAIGTVAGGVAQTVRLLIRPVEMDGAYRVHLSSGTSKFDTLEEAVGCAQKEAEETARALALRAGADQPRVKVERIDRVARGGGVEEIYMETEVIARAVGRPRTAPNNSSPEMET